MYFVLLFASAAICACQVGADTPANCTYGDLVGSWTFYEGPRGNTWDVKCLDADISKFTHTRKIRLDFPDKAVDETTGEAGFWTLVYNQGFEVNIGFRQYFGFSNYTQSGSTVTSFCHQTQLSWTHDVYARDWSCYYAHKNGAEVTKTEVDQFSLLSHSLNLVENAPRIVYKTSQKFVDKINSKQSEWKATAYEMFNGMRVDDVIKMMGGPKSKIMKRPPLTQPTVEVLRQARQLPNSFDWRNVKGTNFVSPVRNQGSCGSCYAFGSQGMLEARYRIATNNSQTPVFSTGDVVDCSYYAQGCAGGFPYLIAGKYAHDIGVVLESCDPYTNRVTCAQTKECRRYYVDRYNYVGGFYGGCNEDLMKLALVNNGPFAVSFEVYNDFMSYASGVYHHTGVKDDENMLEKFDPFHITNHVVVIVGYGTDGGTPYWIVKNSWGTGWGLDGYFKIRRGNDECGIESIAVEAFVMPTY